MHMYIGDLTQNDGVWILSRPNDFFPSRYLRNVSAADDRKIT